MPISPAGFPSKYPEPPHNGEKRRLLIWRRASPEQFQNFIEVVPHNFEFGADLLNGTFVSVAPKLPCDILVDWPIWDGPRAHKTVHHPAPSDIFQHENYFVPNPVRAPWSRHGFLRRCPRSLWTPSGSSIAVLPVPLHNFTART